MLPTLLYTQHIQSCFVSGIEEYRFREAKMFSEAAAAACCCQRLSCLQGFRAEWLVFWGRICWWAELAQGIHVFSFSTSPSTVIVWTTLAESWHTIYLILLVLHLLLEIWTRAFQTGSAVPECGGGRPAPGLHGVKPCGHDGEAVIHGFGGELQPTACRNLKVWALSVVAAFCCKWCVKSELIRCWSYI